MGINATNMLKEVAAGKVVNSYNDKISSKTTTYKVVAIYNGYSQPNGYISKTNADKVLSFNKTRRFFIFII